MCYLPVKRAIREQPELRALIEREEGTLQNLTYVTDSGADSSEVDALHRGDAPSFAGHQTMEERNKSFVIARDMRVHCG